MVKKNFESLELKSMEEQKGGDILEHLADSVNRAYGWLLKKVGIEIGSDSDSVYQKI